MDFFPIAEVYCNSQLVWKKELKSSFSRTFVHYVASEVRKENERFSNSTITKFEEA